MTILDRIIETKRREVAAAKSTFSMRDLQEAADRVEPARDFFSAVVGPPRNGVRLIAEIKKASPSAGLILPDFDPIAIAQTYHGHGAAALSVLSDESYFQGNLALIDRIRRAVPLPVLRKDFIIDEFQVFESRSAGADAVLLIAEVLGADHTPNLIDVCNQLGMTALVEVHSEKTLAALVAAADLPGEGRYLLGINNRDLAVQKTDLANTPRLAAHLPADTPFVAESGIVSRQDVLDVVRVGARAVLVGESLLRSPNIGRKVDELLGR